MPGGLYILPAPAMKPLFSPSGKWPARRSGKRMLLFAGYSVALDQTLAKPPFATLRLRNWTMQRRRLNRPEKTSKGAPLAARPLERRVRLQRKEISCDDSSVGGQDDGRGEGR